MSKEVEKDLKQYMSAKERIKIWLSKLNVLIAFLTISLPLIVLHLPIFLGLLVVAIPFTIVHTFACIINLNFRRWWPMLVLGYIKLWRDTLNAYSSKK